MFSFFDKLGFMEILTIGVFCVALIGGVIGLIVFLVTRKQK